MPYPTPASRLSSWLTPPVVGLVVTMLAVAFALSTQGPGGIAAIWPVNAVVLAVLLRLRKSQWPLVLVCTLIGNVIANLVTGDDAIRGSLLSFGNIVEIGVAAAICRSRGSMRLKRRSGLFRFALGILIGCLLSTGLAFLTLSITGSNLAPQGALLWFAADLLGLAVFTPTLLAIAEGRLSENFTPERRRETIWSLLALTLITAAVFYQTSFPLLFIPPAAVVLIGLRIGTAGASLGILLVSAIAISLSVADRGPLILMNASVESRVLVLQLFLGTLALIALVTGTIVSERNALITRMTRARQKAQYRSGVERRFLNYARLAETMSQVGYWTYNAANGEIFWSPEVYRIHGLDPSSFQPAGDTVSALYDGDYRARLDEAGLACLQTGASWEIDLVLIRRSDQSRREVRCVGSAEKGPGGDIVGLFGVFKDLTEERRIIAAAVEHESRYRLLAENSTDLIATYGIDGTFTYLSPSIFDMLGYRPEDLVGRTTYDVILEEDHEVVKTTFRKVWDNDLPFTVEYRARTRDGEVKWLEARPRFRRDADGRIAEITDTVRDVTLRRAREAALAEARERAETATVAKANFLANMSHEIRTPLNGVLGFAEVLSDTALDANQEKYVNRIRTAGRGLSMLIDDILDFSKIEAGKMVADTQPYDLRDVIAETLFLTQAAATGKAVDFAVDIARDIAQRLMGDSARVRQVLLNLLGNASKFTDAGSIRISAVLTGSIVEVRIVDTGAGIDPQVLDRLFNSFTQGDVSVTRRFGGSGLGLSISRSLALLMNGDLRLESVQGLGTTAVLTLPHIPARPLPSKKITHQLPVNSQGASLSIMLVDDVEMNRELIQVMLERQGHAVTAFCSASAAIDTLRNGGLFDLILMDIQMPEMDGLQATRTIRKLDDALAIIPIIAISANVMPDQVLACKMAGMDDHVSKPIDMRELLAAITRATEQRSDRVEAGELDRAMFSTLENLRDRYRQQINTVAEQFIEITTIKDLEKKAKATLELAHSIAGTAGSLGMERLSRAAFALDLAARNVISNGITAEADLTDSTLRLLHIAKLEGTQPKADTLTEGDRL